MNRPVQCFDVFDTVLTRRVAEPAAVFHFIGREAEKRGLSTLAPSDFAARRHAAEAACRRATPSGETTLAEIYRALRQETGIDRSSDTTLQELELAEEARLICAVPGAAEMLTTARATSPRLIFASDMYLPADFIRARLVAYGFWRDGDTLYLSAEHGCSKQSGRLFQHILTRENLPPTGLHHTGNDAIGDDSAPRRLGIATTWLSTHNLNRYERHLVPTDTAAPPFAALLAGASRLARLAIPADSPATVAIRDVAAGVAGPVLASYVTWLLRTARTRGLNRLYFVSRDGFLLLQLARQLAPRIHPRAELRYLHGSRQAWHLPGVFSMGEAELSWLFCPTDFLSVASACQRLSLPPEKIAPTLLAHGFPPQSWHDNLSTARRSLLRETFRQSVVAEVVLAHAAAARPLLIDYLRQEKLLDGERCALVDVGWHGRTHDSLAKIIRSVGRPPPEGLYLGLNAGSGRSDLGERHAFLFDRRSGPTASPDLPRGLEPLLEAFCTAPDGATIGYRRAGNRIEPIFREAPATLTAWGWHTLQATLGEYGRVFADSADEPVVDADLRATALSALKLFWEHPTPAEAQAWGAFPYEDDQTGVGPHTLAEPLPWQQAWTLLATGQRTPRRAAWWSGSLQLTPPLPRAVVRSAAAVRNLGRTLKHRFT